MHTHAHTATKPQPTLLVEQFTPAHQGPAVLPVASLMIAKMYSPQHNQHTAFSGTFQGGGPGRTTWEPWLEGGLSGVCHMSASRRRRGNPGPRARAGRTAPRGLFQGQRVAGGSGGTRLTAAFTRGQPACCALWSGCRAWVGTNPGEKPGSRGGWGDCRVGGKGSQGWGRAPQGSRGSQHPRTGPPSGCQGRRCQATCHSDAAASVSREMRSRAARV